ncbi:MAG: ABC transporter permease [Fimbriimonadales bacterium]
MFFQSFSIALNMLRLHKLRAFLTMLGVIIGVMSVTLIVMVSEGFRGYITDLFSKLGSDTIFVVYMPSRLMRGQSTGGISGLTEDDARMIRNRCSSVGELSKYIEIGNQLMRVGDKEFKEGQVSGVDDVYHSLNRINILEGRFISSFDYQNRSNVCVIGDEIVKALFPDKKAIGKRIQMKGITLEVIGVTERLEIAGRNTGVIMFVPLSTAQDKWIGGKYFGAIMFRPKKGHTVNEAMQEVWEVMMQKSGNRALYRVDSRESILGVFGQIIGGAGMVLGAIAALSLLVGGIGIMNIMLVSVTERTREIGLRKAIGAKRGAILTQFIIEAAVLSIAGGLIGMIIAYFLGHGISILTKAMKVLGDSGIVVTFPMYAAVIAVAFSALVGIVFGLYPAWSASRLDPIVALRSE